MRLGEKRVKMWRELSFLIVSLAPSLPLYTNKEVRMLKDGASYASSKTKMNFTMQEICPEKKQEKSKIESNIKCGASQI